MLYKYTIKQNLNALVIGGCDCKNLTFEKKTVFINRTSLGHHVIISVLINVHRTKMIEIGATK